MTFEKTIGQFQGNEVSEIVVQAPPAEGWRWHGGENDGKRHGPLRIRGLYLYRYGSDPESQKEMVVTRASHLRSLPIQRFLLTLDAEFNEVFPLSIEVERP